MTIVYKRYALLISMIFAFTFTAKSQILISLLFGDKLNSESIEFGLVTGASFSTLDGVDQADYVGNFSLGFYLNKQFSEHVFLHTGVTPKSTFGAKELKTFPTGNSSLDTLLSDGDVELRFGQTSIPILFSYNTLGKEREGDTPSE